MTKKPARDESEDLTDYWRQLNQEIAKIESRYPFIVTTVITALVGATAATTAEWFQGLVDFFPFVVPVLVLLGLAYILSLFRRVAVLRGYSAFVEDEINRSRSTKIYLWNVRYIDRFEQNSTPNVLMMVLNFTLVAVIIGGLCVFVSNRGLWPWFIDPWWHLAFCVVVLLVLVFIIVGFAGNDEARRRSYEFALFENHPKETLDTEQSLMLVQDNNAQVGRDSKGS
jgi:membrane protein YdbS with pleckstrin-like domain